MKYEIGQKVETPLGVGQLIDTPLGSGVVEAIGNEIVYVSVCNFPSIPFPDVALKPYRTPHEKLLDMGFTSIDTSHYINGKNFRQYMHYELDLHFLIKEKTYYLTKYEEATTVSLELSRILTEYLEWLEEEK